MIPIDIENKVKSLYPDTAAQQAAFAVYEKLKISGTVTGTDQLFRSMLILAESDLKELIRLGDNYWGPQHDDRDIVMYAEDKLGNPGEYGLVPFK